jgi:hypothetical protein
MCYSYWEIMEDKRNICEFVLVQSIRFLLTENFESSLPIKILSLTMILLLYHHGVGVIIVWDHHVVTVIILLHHYIVTVFIWLHHHVVTYRHYIAASPCCHLA